MTSNLFGTPYKIIINIKKIQFTILYNLCHTIFVKDNNEKGVTGGEFIRGHHKKKDSILFIFPTKQDIN